jgi:uncharacterized protein
MSNIVHKSLAPLNPRFDSQNDSIKQACIGFVGGMVGLVLGVLRLVFIILGVESSFSSSSSSSVGVAAGTNIGVIMAVSGSIGGFFGSPFTNYAPANMLLRLIAIIVLYMKQCNN